MIPQPSYYTDVNLRHLRHIFRKSHISLILSEHFRGLTILASVITHQT